MQHMHVFYAHDYTWTLVVDELTPELTGPELRQEVQEKSIRVWYDPESVMKSVPLKAHGEESRYTQQPSSNSC